VPACTQMGIGSAQCVLSLHATQVFAIHAGSPGVLQSVSPMHWRQVAPTQTGPLALPAQCVLFWHCTHIMVARLQARLFMGAIAQSASDMQRSWQVLVLPAVTQTCGGAQPAVGVHTRHEFVATLQ
jgi:hypothetical protein